MLSYRLGAVNTFHWRFKPVFRYSKPHIFLTFVGKEYENKNYLLSPPRPSRYEQATKVKKESKF